MNSVGQPVLVSNVLVFLGRADFPDCSAGAIEHPDAAVDAVPRPFVTEHQQRRIGGREQQMVEPVSTLQYGFDRASFRIQRE